MNLSEIFGTSAMGVLSAPIRLLGLLRPWTQDQSKPLPDRLAGLLDTSALEDVVREAVPWGKIQKNISSGRLDALCVTATEVTTGRAIVFVESHHSEELHWSHDPSIVARPAHLTSEHALASAAIPGLFPAVRIDDDYFSDGGLRLNTPLSPVLRLGADRVLVIALRQGPVAEDPHPLGADRVSYSASPVYLLGKALNALLLEHIDRDLRQMRLLNDIMRRAQEVGGSDFVDRINETVVRDRGQPFKIVEDLVVRPSADVGLLASEAARDVHHQSHTSRGVRLALRALGFVDSPFEADLLSYLFFDRSYTAQLLELGRADARRNEEALARFFSD